VRPPDPLLGEEEAVPATDLLTTEAAPAGTSVVVVPTGSATERSPDPRCGRARQICSPEGGYAAPAAWGCLHTSPRRHSALRGREVARGGAALRVAAAWEGGRGAGVVVGGGVLYLVLNINVLHKQN
jgi:hypothetical protein